MARRATALSSANKIDRDISPPVSPTPTQGYSTGFRYGAIQQITDLGACAFPFGTTVRVSTRAWRRKNEAVSCVCCFVSSISLRLRLIAARLLGTGTCSSFSTREACEELRRREEKRTSSGISFRWAYH